jgi:DNA-binding MarR family transcriptional regulator
MSEEQEDYITDALEMIGIVEPKKIETHISGFIPMFEYVLDFYKDPITALVFGRRWQYCRMSDGVCRAALSRLASDLHLDEATISRHTEKLVKDGFLVDTTPERRNRPHVYADAGRVAMKASFSATVAQSNVGIAQSNAGIAESTMIKQDKTINKKGDILDGVLFYGKQAIEQGEDKIEAVITELERGLKVNIARTTKNQSAARRIVKDGRPVQKWLSWLVSDEWRASHLYLYADLDRVWREYPQAFEQGNNINPQGLEIGF